jgi:hypothetical protein
MFQVDFILGILTSLIATILFELRFVLKKGTKYLMGAIVVATKYLHGGYSQIKKTIRLQSTVNKPPSILNQLYKKVLCVRQNEQTVRHSLQKKSNTNGFRIKDIGIAVLKKSSVSRILLMRDRILFLKSLTA